MHPYLIKEAAIMYWKIYCTFIASKEIRRNELDFVLYIREIFTKKPELGGMYSMKSSTLGSIGLNKENELYILQFIYVLCRQHAA